MATPFSNVYDYFLSKVSDHKFIRLNKSGDLESVLFSYLRSSIVRFTVCTKDLEVDEFKQEFISDLSMDEKEILSVGMVLAYTTTKLLDIKNNEQYISEADLKKYSQANHMKELNALKSDVQSEFSQLQNSYSLKNGLEDLD